ncbi:uncharacterized protein LOC135819162 [Sycon ciliatum]|uniref:uncharacterized protein LOC135819162 n=1 Tax=Sycon ciliatum TaxID=27933 RepID=UPI0031F6B29A
MNCTFAGGAFTAVPTCEACNHTNLDGVEQVDSNGTVTCRYDTFKATASGPAMCNASGDGFWTWTETCTSCTTPPTANANISANGSVSCKTGFVQTSTTSVKARCDDSRAAGASANWTGFGQCQPVCSLPQIDNSQSVNGSGHSRDEKYTSYLVTCKAGFYLSNLNYPMNCTFAGGAFTAVPTCEACNHTNLYGVEKVESNGTVTCRYDTFKATTSGPAMCNASGDGFWTWTETCANCTTPDTANASIAANGTVSCTTGFVQTATSVKASCNDRAATLSTDWTDVGQCKPVCNLPSIMNHASIIGTGSQVLNKYTMYDVTCKSGFYRHPSMYQRECRTANGGFSQVPSCRSCSHADLGNVQEIADATGEVTCTYGAFKTLSSQNANCDINGGGSQAGKWQWTGRCIPCTTPGTANASIAANGTVSCTTGFVQTATSVNAICDDRATMTSTDWTDVGQCKPVCNLPTITNSMHVTGGRHSVLGNPKKYTSYSVACSPGFYLSDPGYSRQCTSGGGMFLSVPQCESCSHADLGNVQEIADATGEVTCTYGAFKTLSSQNANCDINGGGSQAGKWQWTGRCIPCTTPDTANASIAANGTVSCTTGFVQTATSVTAICDDRTTTLSTDWTDVGQCKPVCNLPSIMNHASIIGTGSQVLNKYTMYDVTCKSGFYRNPSTYERECRTANGGFPQVPFCQSCSHADLGNVQEIADATGEVTCTYGAFKTLSSQNANCDINGGGSQAGKWQWTGRCIPCTTPGTANASIAANGTVSCTTGFVQTATSVNAICDDRATMTSTDWTDVGQCKPFCTTPSVNNGRVTTTAVLTKARFYEVTCNTNYQLTKVIYHKECHQNPTFTLIPMCAPEPQTNITARINDQAPKHSGSVSVGHNEVLNLTCNVRGKATYQWKKGSANIGTSEHYSYPDFSPSTTVAPQVTISCHGTNIDIDSSIQERMSSASITVDQKLSRPIISGDTNVYIDFVEGMAVTPFSICISFNVHPQPVATDVAWAVPRSITFQTSFKMISGCFESKVTIDATSIREASGTYNVTVMTMGGTTTYSVTVEVRSQPKVTVSEPTNLTVVMEKSAPNWTFIATGNPKPTLTLQYEGSAIQMVSGDMMPSRVLQTSTITIAPSTLRNASGLYTFLASNSIATATHSARLSHRLIVTSSPTITYPTTRTIINTREFRAFTLSCDVNGNPGPYLSLFDSSSILTNVSSNTGNDNDLVSKSISKSYMNMTRNQTGNYSCSTRSNLYPTPQIVHVEVIVQYPPELCTWASSRTLVYRPDQNRSINVMCSCNAVPFATYTHTNDLRYGPMKGKTTTNVTASNSPLILTIHPTAAGIYECQAANNASTKPSEIFNSKFTIDIKAPPHMSFTDNTVTVGDNITVNCTVSSFPQSTGLVWRYANNTNIVDNSVFTVTKHGMPLLNGNSGLFEQTISLSITDVKQSHRLNYLCVADNGISPIEPALDFRGNSDVTATATLSLNVQGLFRTRLFMDAPRQKVYHVDQALIAKCTATGNPQPAIKWFSTTASFDNATETRSGVKVTKYSFNTTTEQAVGILQIDNIQYSDEGYYWCTVDNDVDMTDSNSLNVTVLGSPKNTLITPTITVNESTEIVNLDCEFTSLPISNVAWYDGSREELSNSSQITITVYPPTKTSAGDFKVKSTLSLTNVTRENLNKYLCVASNGLANTTNQINIDQSSRVESSFSATATTSLNVLFGANFTTDLQEEYILDVSQNFTLTCIASGNPLPVITWNSTATLFSNDTISEIWNGQSKSRSLRIVNANETLHSGVYYCVVSNTHGRAVSTMANISIQDINECGSNPCMNGQCTPGIAQYTCQCDAGWRGSNCEIKAEDYNECLSNPCSNNATCVDGILSYKCICPDGYTGSVCQSLLPCPDMHTRDRGGVFCKKCSCNTLGTHSCDPENGTCYCNQHIGGETCDQCQLGFYPETGKIDSCQSCPCVANTTQAANTCNTTSGICNCLDNYSGHRCQLCSTGHYKVGGECTSCQCSAKGSYDLTCDIATGACRCRPGHTGSNCFKCEEGYFQPATNGAHSPCVAYDSSIACQVCYCSPMGSNGSSCNNGTGKCQCLPGYTGDKCDSCISPSQFHTESGGCQDLDQQLFNGSTSSLVNGSSLNLNYPFVFGSRFTSHREVSVSFDGFMSLNRFSGGYNVNSRVTEHLAIIAPYWTTRFGNQSCSAGTVETHHVNKTVDPVTFSAIQEMIEVQYKPVESFRPEEAVITTWREIRENNQHNGRNTFQAAIISDDCQSFAVFNYPDHGITWKGFPYAVIAPGTILATSGTANVLPTSGIYNLTNGCSAKLRAQKECQQRVTNASLIPYSTMDIAECPAHIDIIEARAAFSKQDFPLHECYISAPITRGSNQLSSHCCYYKRNGQLIDSGLYQPFQSISPEDINLRNICNTGGMLSHFLLNRNSPEAAEKRTTVQQSYCYGDPHLASIGGEKFDFHVVGEFVLGDMHGTDLSMQVTARMEIVPVDNDANFTSITRVGVVLRQNLSSITIQVFSKEGNIEVEGNLTTQDIRDGHENFELQRDANSIIARIGSFAANISVQSDPILVVALQIQRNASFTGLLDIDRGDASILLNSTELRLKAKQYQVNESTSPFVYSNVSTYGMFNPTTPPMVGTVNTSAANVSACSGDLTCVADFLASKDLKLAKSTLMSNKELKSTTKTAARTPPLISWTPSALHGTYTNTSRITIMATATGADIESITHNATGINVTVFKMQSNTLMLTWTPAERRPTGSVVLQVTATDSNNETDTRTIPLTLCGCYGICKQPPAADQLSVGFTQLDCLSCDAGRTGLNCEGDLNSCENEPCSDRYVCTDIPLPNTGYMCECRTGFTESYGRCYDVDECSRGTHNCPTGRSMCQNAVGSFLCSCSPGYTGENCNDINECSSNMNECDDKNSICTNTMGGHTCSCPRGFAGTGRLREGGCYDINACSNNVHDCIAASVCTDDGMVLGGHTCTCPDSQLQTFDQTCDVKPSLSEPELQKTTANFGDKISFQCAFIGLIRNSVTWNGPNRKQIQTNQSFTVSQVKSNVGMNATLAFTLTSTLQAGNFTCTGGNSRDSTSKTFELTLDRSAATATDNSIIYIAVGSSCGGLLIIVLAGILIRRQRLSASVTFSGKKRGSLIPNSSPNKGVQMKVKEGLTKDDDDIEVENVEAHV